MILQLLALTLLCYLIGSISSAILLSKLFKLADPRSYGSNNPGATNVLRSGNKLAACCTLLGDALKGSVAVWLAQQFFADISFALECASVAVFLGHLYPIFFKFQGGKGVATAIGIILASNWMLGLMTLFVWLNISILFRISAVAAIFAAILTPYFAYNILQLELYYCIAISIICCLLIWRHRNNILNICQNFLK